MNNQVISDKEYSMNDDFIILWDEGLEDSSCVAITEAFGEGAQVYVYADERPYVVSKKPLTPLQLKSIREGAL